MLTVPESLVDVLECGKQYYDAFHVPLEKDAIKAGVREYARHRRMEATSAHFAVRSELLIWLSFAVGFVKEAEQHKIVTAIRLPYDDTAYTPETVKEVIDDLVKKSIAVKFIPSFDCDFRSWDSEKNILLKNATIIDQIVGIAAVIEITFP